MKTLIASLVIGSCIAASAVSFEVINSPNISSPGSIKPMATMLDRNFAAAKAAVDALDVKASALPAASITNALVGTLTTNIIYGVNGKTNTFIWSAVGPVKVLKSLTITP